MLTHTCRLRSLTHPLTLPPPGMSAGLPKYVTVNLSDLEKNFEAGATVDLQSVQDKKLLNISGRDTKLPLKVRHTQQP